MRTLVGHKSSVRALAFQSSVNNKTARPDTVGTSATKLGHKVTNQSTGKPLNSVNNNTENSQVHGSIKTSHRIQNGKYPFVS